MKAAYSYTKKVLVLVSAVGIIVFFLVIVGWWIDFILRKNLKAVAGKVSVTPLDPTSCLMLITGIGVILLLTLLQRSVPWPERRGKFAQPVGPPESKFLSATRLAMQHIVPFGIMTAIVTMTMFLATVALWFWTLRPFDIDSHSLKQASVSLPPLSVVRNLASYSFEQRANEADEMFITQFCPHRLVQPHWVNFNAFWVNIFNAFNASDNRVIRWSYAEAIVRLSMVAALWLVITGGVVCQYTKWRRLLGRPRQDHRDPKTRHALLDPGDGKPTGPLCSPVENREASCSGPTVKARFSFRTRVLLALSVVVFIVPVLVVSVVHLKTVDEVRSQSVNEREELDPGIEKTSGWKTLTVELYSPRSQSPEQVRAKRAHYVAAPRRRWTWGGVTVTAFVTDAGKIWAGPEQGFYIEADSGVVGGKICIDRGMVQWCNSLIKKQSDERISLKLVMERFEKEVRAHTLTDADNDRLLAATYFGDILENFVYPNPGLGFQCEVRIAQVIGNTVCFDVKGSRKRESGNAWSDTNVWINVNVWIDIKSRKVLKAIGDGEQVFPK